MTYETSKTLKRGQKIKSIYGETLTVMLVNENMITTYEGGLIHITKAWPI